jgi:nicotinamidase-related amidase
MRLERLRTSLVVIDVQEKLFPHIDGHGALEEALVKLVRGAHVLDLPMIVTEQYVKGLGPTIAPVREALGPAYAPIEKMSFSSARDNSFLDALARLERPHVLVCGIEAHVCVYQTAIDLLDRGYHVHVVTDAVGSRSPRNLELAIRRMEQGGALSTSSEMCLFELLEVSGTAMFKAVSKLVK